MEGLCRLCLKEDVVLRTVGRSCSAASIEAICCISIKTDDCLSQKICSECSDTVKKAFELRNISMKNELILLERLATSVCVKVEANQEDKEVEPFKIEEIYSDLESCSASLTDETPFEDIPLLKLNQKDDRFICDLCSETAKTKSAIEKHIRNLHFDNICRLCKKQFSSYKAMRRHMRRIHNSRKYFSCEECSVSFENRTHFKKHKDFHNFIEEKTNEDQTKYFKCRECSKTFDKYSENISIHIVCHKNENKKLNRIESNHNDSFICPHCAQIFYAKKNLDIHIKRHFNEFSCAFCPQKFKARAELNKHKVVHTTERNFICDICQKAFKSKRILREHKIRHETKDVKKFQCSHCQRMLKSKYSLSRHLLIHTGEKKFTCSYCDCAYIQKTELNK